MVDLHEGRKERREKNYSSTILLIHFSESRHMLLLNFLVHF